jgi:hypothetical protein
MIRAFLKQLFCVEENGVSRVSLTKSGANIQAISMTIGSVVSGSAFLSGSPKVSLISGIITLALREIGVALVKIGQRNTVVK